MSEVCEDRSVMAVLSEGSSTLTTIKGSSLVGTGDNFYEGGISTNEFDDRFKSTFEDVFSSPSLQGAAVKVLVVMIDTIVLDGLAEEGSSYNCRDGEGICMSEYDGDHRELSRTQRSALEWIENALSKHDGVADFILVVGHYPIWSLAEHGPTYRLSRLLMPIFTKYRVTAYLSGHDHVHQHLYE
ncbi:tartrate-resistant acid phosphatase type, putative [Perkinsus marinus ATCC 50983]|uniref:Tartrate-resistant acid phosphatase type, putative n=1 Tax=Perkinsus marinus (strain ATCC 50983 / TXsc) TaxID=423536 RepID=C5KAF9_PERM5|nr:tartrate-resistant acid phosphatase type, putative [Perkinsus marinus ATCC 50983]EER18495.1 tartrate-resistant acid phosphatase type, putative [Perkinsus marinus ATCC 50983]|eukprot:XP_002786699.1 tartrate-resistant acid phosphatase type, putative [Perkinsus marinus ATCC 50983]